MRRIFERRRPKAHSPGEKHDHPPGESCYRCRHGRGVVECACRYARKASGFEADQGPRACVAYAGRLIAGLVLLTGRRFGPGLALVAARPLATKLVPALAAVPALFKSVWVWLGGFSVAAATAITVGSSPAPAPPTADPVPAAAPASSTACAVEAEPVDGRCATPAEASRSVDPSSDVRAARP